MANYRSQTWLYRWFLQMHQPQNSRNYGFTLIEILISMVMAGIVISGLLFLMVELLRVDRREIVLEQVQRDMQRAIDYVADDLKEAVYVYSSPTDITDQIGALDSEIAADAEPVLAFWRPDPLDASLPADCSGEGTNEQLCNLIKTRGATYSLVVYYQQPKDTTSVWEGETTLRRYELSQYSNLSAAGAAKYTLNTGYADPVTNTGSNFETWTPTTSPTNDTDKKVLVDYVDAIDLAATSADAVDCRNLIFNLNQGLTGETNSADEQYDYVLSPQNTTSTTGFFACVRNPEMDGTFRTNQDVYLFLKGNASSANRFLQPASAASRLPVLQTQVKLGGVIDRDGE
ncbi:PulJ/GspJ family protein [Leptothoe sp. PORK10 BA2]|uniref:PulJ/GspJ family protein n=1 Tax=Leptothoe sp. PORK10 BA2 TaxID=3110254 RepID=UPI002B21F416|nr:type II secretion system protein [Leptothoe sp. PORK10 BA2]MEA5466010.1 type II secretion system protein [Leptothoe sp. PORK10 BA2]